ncbi:MAG TPA: glucosamine-6-phosphate deaminase [Chloroflexota bacterium]|nr:glucosamine-6-phosphate deaminase [Chloroflexota bacterium]
MSNPRVIVADSATDVAARAADHVEAVIARRPTAVLVLPTGRTPVELYRELKRRYAAGRIDFGQVRTFNLDEWVGVAPDEPGSYAGFMTEQLFSRVNLSAENCHIPNGLAPDLDAECRRYDELIRQVGGVDLAILGIGGNGHIGFNEPGTSPLVRTHAATVEPSTQLANAYAFDGRPVPSRALTMGIATILEAREILLLATGAEKAEILLRALTGPITEGVPASILRRHSNVSVLADKLAAAQLPPGERG